MGRHVLVLIAALALVMPVGCSEVIPDSPCRQVFRGNQMEGGGFMGLAALDPAIRACTSVDEWRSAWDEFPKSHSFANDPIGFLKERCQVAKPSLTDTTLCKAAASLR